MAQSSPESSKYDKHNDGSIREGRRARLRDFQSNLVERMQAVKRGAGMPVNHLGVMVAGQRWLLDLKQAGEITTIAAITPVPLTQDWYLGLSNMRGNLVGIIDFARFQGAPATVIDRDSRVIAFAPALGFNCGLLVSRVLGLRSSAEMTLKNQDAHADTAAWSTRQYVDREAQVWTELDLSLVTKDSRFLHIGS
jgi:twitching motility protein PilI